MDEHSKAELERCRREKNLYARLLALGDQQELDPFLREALEIVADVTGAAIGYLEIHDTASLRSDPASITFGVDDAGAAANLKERVSSGIISQVMSTGQTIDTPSALFDPRFNSRDSVIARAIPAVLCVPIGGETPRGALYLQGRKEAAAFTGDARECAEIFAEQLDRLAARLLAAQRTLPERDPTRAHRERINAEALVGTSPALATLLKELCDVSPIDVGLLLSGDSGTGKSLVARVVHDNSPRKAEPFVEINCSTIPENLFENEIFGAVPGGHDQARAGVVGKVAAAERGTLFLDEISEMPLAAQAKLLQLLQSKVYYPLGSAEPQTANVRIIAATNIDLEEAVAEGRFRQDLYFRLHVLPVHVPSLAERSGDLLPLAEHFVQEASLRYGFAPLPFSPAALRAIETSEWPGNVRQLAHAVEAALIRARGEHALQIERAHLFPKRADRSTATENDPPLTYQQATRQFQRDLLERTLAENDGNVTHTAEQLDLARTHAHKLIRAHGLVRR